MKVPAECPGEQTKEEKKRLKVERQAAAAQAVEAPVPSSSNGTAAPQLTRQDTMNSLSSGYATTANRSVSGLNRVPSETTLVESSPIAAAPAPATSSPTSAPRRNRIVAPPPAAYVGNSGDDASASAGKKRGKMLYPYEARDPAELTIAEGKEFEILEPDDGGWTKIKAGFGQEGIVPTAYFEEIASSPATAQRPPHERTPSTYSNSSASLASTNKKQGPAVAPRRGAKKVKYAEALYPYTAQSDAEFDMEEGEKFILISMGTGDGWADVEKNGEKRIVPAAYIQEI